MHESPGHSLDSKDPAETCGLLVPAMLSER